MLTIYGYYYNFLFISHYIDFRNSSIPENNWYYKKAT